MIEGEARTIKRCRKNHQFTPSGSDMVMSRISGTDFKETKWIDYFPSEVILEELTAVKFHVCFYENEWYFGLMN